MLVQPHEIGGQVVLQPAVVFLELAVGGRRATPQIDPDVVDGDVAVVTSAPGGLEHHRQVARSFYLHLFFYKLLQYVVVFSCIIKNCFTSRKLLNIKTYSVYYIKKKVVQLVKSTTVVKALLSLLPYLNSINILKETVKN